MKRWVIWGTTVIVICAAYAGWYHFNNPSSVTTPDTTQNVGKEEQTAPQMLCTRSKLQSQKQVLCRSSEMQWVSLSQSRRQL